MVTEDDKNRVNDVIIRSITGRGIKYNDPDQVKHLLEDIHLENKDYEAILKKKNDVDLQLRNDHEYLCTLIALRRYASEIEQDVVTTNSHICLDNYEEELESYCRSYM